MQRCALPSNARAVSKQLLLPNGRALVRIPRRSFADAATITPPKPSGGVGRTLRRIALFSTLATGTFYVGSTFLSFRSTQYHDFFVEQVPLGTSVLQFAEDHDWDELDVHAVTDAVVAAGAGVSGAWQKVKELTGQAESEAEKKVDAASAEAAKARDAAFNRAIAARDSVVNKAKDATTPKQPTLKEKAIEKKDAVVSKAKAAAASTKEAVSSATDKAKHAATGLVTSVEKSTESASAVARSQADQFTSEIEHLTSQAEAILSGKKSISEILANAEHSVAEAVSENVSTPEEVNAEEKKNLYTAPLPIGFEPPPGFSRPAPPKPAKSEASNVTGKDGKTAPAPPAEPLPLLAPAVAALGASEPVISQLAGTIDTLASSLAPSTSSPANAATDAKARAALSEAQSELEALAARVESVRSDARAELEKTLEAQAADYNSKVLSVEMEAQDRMDAQEDGFRKILQEEREEMVRRYREKLEKELEVQSEIIDQRLKEEVIAQGIELQRRWIREIKVRVENERGGRLSKLEELAASLKRLEGLALDNARVLDDTARAHALWSALRAVGGAVTAPVRKPFRDELRILRAAAGNKNVNSTAAEADGETKADSKQDDVVKAALGVLEAGETADVGVEPLSALTAWFRTSVAPAVERVALVPDHGAGLLSHLASHLLSTVRFRHEVTAGNQLPKGGDVLSVLARAGYWLEEKDLDKAAREVNQLSGVSKELVKDWLDAARRRLEVEQALEIIQSEATVASLLVA